MNGFPSYINSRQDLENLLADTAYKTQAVTYLQALADEEYGYTASGAWGICPNSGLSRLGITRAEAVAMGAVDRVIAEPERHGPTLADLKAAACARIEAHRISLETAGVMISWPDGTKSKIQTRDERDWRNINGVAARGLARLMQGLADDDWFRDADDKNHTLLPPQAVDMGYQAASAISAIAKAAQDAKDAIRADTVTTAEQIAAAEAAVVWPV